MLRLEDVHKWFGSLHVLKGICLSVRRGEVVVIIGRSGSGKSTILRCINGLEPIQQGRILVDGDVVDAHSRQVRKIREEVGFVFQSFNLFPYYTALENVSLALMIVKKMPPQRPVASRNRCWPGWDCWTSSRPIRIGSPVGSSSGWLLPALWP